ncbi:MAG: adenylate kinase family protein [Janthinobacterium lividum]
MRLVLLGPPGAGKGTQGQALAVIYNVPHVATGDILRDHIARGTEFGRKIEAAIAAGNFASDQDILHLVDERLAEPDAQNGYILDGFPRDAAQAEAFIQPLDAVVDLEIDVNSLIERLSGRLVCPVCDTVYNVQHHPPKRAGICDNDGTILVRRPDDDRNAVRNRLRVYRELTLPLRAYYDKRGLLRRIDAQSSPDTVTERIRIALANQDF